MLGTQTQLCLFSFHLKSYRVRGVLCFQSKLCCPEGWVQGREHVFPDSLFSLMCLLVHTSPDDVSQAALGSGVNNLMSKFLSPLFYIRLHVSAGDYKNRVEMS